MAGAVRQGSVWMASVPDANGHAKLRPVVVATPDAEIILDSPIVVVAITTRLHEPLPRTHVALPWSPRGHPATGLWKPCAAVCTWLIELRPSDLQQQKGYLPGRTLVALLERLRELHGDHDGAA